MTEQRILVIVAAFVLIGLLQFFIKKTTIGSSIEAVAQCREGAMLVGINVDRRFVTDVCHLHDAGLHRRLSCRTDFHPLVPTWGRFWG